jgi:hypothetical protein
MSTKRPTAPAAGAALVSLTLSTVVPLTTTSTAVLSTSILSLVHSSGPMSAGAS